MKLNSTAILLALIPLIDRVLADFRMAEIFIILTILYQSKKRIGSSIIITFLLITAFGFLSLLSGGVNEYSVKFFVSINFALCYLVLINLQINQNDALALLKAIVLATTLHSIILIISSMNAGFLPSLIYAQSEVGRQLFDVRLPFVRTAGLFNHYGYNTAYTLGGLFSIIILRNLGYFKRIHLFYFSVNIVALFMSQSRLSWVVILCLILYLVFDFRRYVLIYVRSIFWISTIFLLYSLYINHELIWELLVSVKRLSVTVRFEQIETGIKLFQSSPLFGVGYAAYFAFEHEHVLHNGWIILLYSTGIFGLGLFIIGIIHPLIYNSKSNQLGFALLFIFLAALVMSTTSGLGFLSVWMLFGLAQLAVRLKIHRNQT